ncbi:MAG: Mur ligase domain-containing protein, partial [Patescibacteria group bacterium]
MRHIYFSGIGGTGIGPLALIAHQAGYTVSGSDKQASGYIDYLKSQGIDNIHIGQTREAIGDVNAQQPIDWLVHSSAVSIENPNHPELVFAKENNIKTTKRDDLLNQIIADKNLKLIGVAGTHGKTTTTAMVIWMFKQLGIPVSYSVGAKISFGEMGHFDPASEYFVYECDEYDRNFLSFKPEVSIIPGIDYDHPDIYPTREEYYKAFNDFFGQSKQVFAHAEDYEKIGLSGQPSEIDVSRFTLIGEVNRKNALLVVEAIHELTDEPIDKLIEIANTFP